MMGPGGRRVVLSYEGYGLCIYSTCMAFSGGITLGSRIVKVDIQPRRWDGPGEGK